MLNIIICEDNKNLRIYYQMIIKDYIRNNPERNIKIVLSTGNPKDISIYLNSNSNELNFFLLDIEFPDSKIKGIDLATEIRNNDLNSKIVFITTHEELMPMIFERKVEPLDYISKESGIKKVKEKLCNDLDIAIQRFLKTQNNFSEKFTFKIASKSFHIDIDQINFFESIENTSNILLHAINQNIEFPDTLKSISNRLPSFYRAHKGYLINLNNVQSIKKHENRIFFKNGSFSEISRRKLADLSKKHPELIK